MDFMKLLKSIEELLYELVSWVVFYPLTLWRIIRHPVASLAYAERELEQPEERQYDDSVSPPILLLISLGLLHVLGDAIKPPGVASMTGILADDRNLLAFRAVAFSFFPLLFGLIQLWVRRARITRTTFKPVFYSQCYATVPFVFAISIGVNLMGFVSQSATTAYWGGGIFVVGLIWYGVVQTIWLTGSARLHPIWSALIVVATLVCALPFFFLVGAIVGYAASEGGVL